MVDSVSEPSSLVDRNTMPFGRSRRNHTSSVRSSQVEAEGMAWLCFPADRSWFQGTITSKYDESNYSLHGRRDSLTSVSVVDRRPSQSSSSEESPLVQDLLEKFTQAFEIDESEHPRKASCGESVVSSEEDSSYTDSVEVPSSESSSKEDFVTYSTDEEELSKSDEYYGRYSVFLTDHFSGMRYQLPKILVKFNGGAEQTPCSAPLSIVPSDDVQVSFQVDHVHKGQKADMVIQKKIGAPALLGQKCVVYSGPMSIVFQHVLETGQSWCL